jgi:hypothetical protein
MEIGKIVEFWHLVDVRVSDLAARGDWQEDPASYIG